MAFILKRISVTPGGFGEALKELREQRGYSLDEVSRATGIHATIIKALEEERVEELLDPYYEERHVRAVVAVLEGQQAYFLEKYHSLLETKGIKRDQDALLRPRVRRRDLFVGSRFLAFLGFLALVLVLAGYVTWQARELSLQPQLEVVAPQDGALLGEPKMDVTGATDPAAFVTVNGRRAVVEKDGKFSLTFDVPDGVTVVRIEAKRRYGSATVIERHVIYRRVTTETASSTQ